MGSTCGWHQGPDKVVVKQVVKNVKRPIGIARIHFEVVGGVGPRRIRPR